MRRLSGIFACLTFLWLLAPASAQIPGGGVSQSGSVTPNNCTKWIGNGLIGDAGTTCGGTGSPGGSNTQLQYNNSGSFGGITGATTNGTSVTLTSPTFITPALGTPASGVATNLTGTASGLTAGNVTGGAIQPLSGTSATVAGMTAGAAVSDTDLFYSGQSSGTTDRKVTGAQVKTYANTSAVRATTTTSEALANSDQNKLVTFSNAGAVACTIAQAGSGGNFAAGWAVSLKNLGAGTVTCTPTTSTVDGAANFTLTTGQGVDLYSDGTNYFTQPGKGGGGTVTTTGSPANGNLTQFSGASSITNGNLSGDCTTSGTLATTCPGPHPGYIASNYYLPVSSQIFGTTSAATANRILCYYAFVPQVITINTVGLGFVAAGSSNSQAALYKSASGRPGALIDKTGNILNTGANSFVTGALGGSQQIGPGTANGQNIWWCTNQNDSTVTYRGLAGSGGIFGSFYQGSATLGTTMTQGGITPASIRCDGAACNGGSSTFNTWPATLAGTTWTDVTGNNTALVAFQVLSVP